MIGRRSMAWIKSTDIYIEQFLERRIHVRRGTGGQIGTSITGSEDRVTGKKGVCTFIIETDASRSVSRSRDDGKSVVTDVENVGRKEFLAYDRTEIYPQSVCKRDNKIGFRDHFAFVLTDICGTAELIDYRGKTSHMVCVTMGEENSGKAETSEFLPDL